MKKNRDRPSIILTFRWLALLWFIACNDNSVIESPQSSETSPPSEIRTIVLISLDTLRADHLGAYGHQRFTTPTLDQLALEGVVFEDASSTAPWTLPAHASMLTGLTPHRHGLVTSENGLSAEIRTLPRWFAEAGWQTSAIVNVLWLRREKYGLTRDFQNYRSIKRSNYRQVGASTLITEAAMDQIEAQGKDPLFLFVHYFDIHADYGASASYEKLLVGPYAGKADGSAWQLMRANFDPEHIRVCMAEFDPRICEYGSKEIPRRIDSEMETIEFDEEDIQHIEELYDAGIRQTDAEIARFLNFLQASGRAQDTLVIVTSDHGEEFMEHGRVDHFLTTYQESLRVPLIMRGPGVPNGKRFDQPVSLIDIAPTLLSLAGLPTPRSLDGTDLSELWADTMQFDWANRALYGEASGGNEHKKWLPHVYPIFRSVRQGDLKLVESTVGRERGHQLFDLRRDPLESTDLSLDRPEDLARLKKLLKERSEAHSNTPLGSPIEMTPDEVQELRALGYVP